MGTNSKNSPSSERTFFNDSPSNKKYSSGSHQQQQQRPSPSKSINIKTPNKNHSSNGVPTANNKRNSRPHSTSPPMLTSTYFAASKCFESPSPQSLPKPPTAWFSEDGKKTGSYKASVKPQRARKSLNLSAVSGTQSCAAEFAKQQGSFASSNDHYTHSLKLLLNLSA